MTNPSSIRLTQFAKRAGCAAKQPPDYLLSLLAGLPPIVDPNVLVGHATSDDAAVYRLSDDLDALSRDVLEDVQYLLWYLEKPVSVWWVEGDYTMACGRYR